MLTPLAFTESLAYRLHKDAALNCTREVLLYAQAPMATTKFGPDSSVLLHMVTELNPDTPVVWIDTGYNSVDTLEFVDQLTQRLALNLKVYRPQNSTLEVPPPLDTEEHAQFTLRTKLEPFERALRELAPDVWISSIRRYQSPHRAVQNMFDQTEQRLKVSPLLDWTQASVDQYKRDHDLPTGPMVNDPTKGEAKRECGLHTRQHRATAQTAAA